MPEILQFRKVKNGTIFAPEFEDLPATGNSEIELQMQRRTSGGMSVIYAPNGTGKTSLTSTLACTASTEEKTFTICHDGIEITPENSVFHIIENQMNRNIIRGNTSDYLVGANIREEYELKERIERNFQLAFSALPKTLKTEYKITKGSNFLLSNVANQAALHYIIAIEQIKLHNHTS